MGTTCAKDRRTYRKGRKLHGRRGDILSAESSDITRDIVPEVLPGEFDVPGKLSSYRLLEAVLAANLQERPLNNGIELFGADGMLYYALACGLSYVLSGYTGLYSSQRILYDKLKAQFIDVHANAYREGEVTETERRYP